MGTVKNGHMEGFGKHIWMSDYIYNGYVFLKESQYEGEFKNDCLHGEGKLVFGNEDMYEGGFKKNLPHG